MSNGCQNGIPILIGIPVHDLFHEFGLADIRPVNALGLTVAFYLVPASDDVVFLHLALEPLVNFILSLGALHNTQPVPAGPLGVLGSDDLQLVAVLNHILNGHQLAVDPGSHHLITHSTVYTICKVNGGGTAGQGFYIP